MISTIEEQKQTHAKLIEENKMLEQRHKEEIAQLNEAVVKLTEKHTVLENEHKKAIKLLKFYQEQETHAVNWNETPKRMEYSSPNGKISSSLKNTDVDNCAYLQGGNSQDYRPNATTDSIKIENQADRSFSRRKKERRLLTVQTGKTLQQMTKGQTQDLAETMPSSNNLPSLQEIKEKDMRLFKYEEESKSLEFEVKSKDLSPSLSPGHQAQAEGQQIRDLASRRAIASTFNHIFRKPDSKTANSTFKKNIPGLVQQLSSPIELIKVKKTEEKINEPKNETLSKPVSGTMHKLLLEKQKLDAQREKTSQINEPKKSFAAREAINEDTDSDDSFYTESFAVARKVLLNPNLKNTTGKSQILSKPSVTEEFNSRLATKNKQNLSEAVKNNSQISALKNPVESTMENRIYKPRDYSPNIDESESEITRFSCPA